MRYFGGKAKIANQITDVINAMVPDFENYVEPFTGGANILAKVKHPRRIGGDANTALITMYAHLQNGWTPPVNLSKEEYAYIKEKNDAMNPLTAFAAFGCSFAGKWFGGYASSKDRNYAENAHNSLMKKAATLKDVIFYSGNYDHKLWQNCLIYCDPPYAGTTGYDGVKDSFNSDMFWQWCRNQHKNGNLVLVSEYSAPEDFSSILTINTKTDIRLANGLKDARREELFMWIG